MGDSTNSSVSANKDPTTVSIQCDFRILSEASPAVFLLSGDNRSTKVDADILNSSLAGTLFLAECYGSYTRRCLIWLWQHGLRGDNSTTLRIVGKVPDVLRGGWLYLIDGCDPSVQMHETALEGRLSGRVLTRGWTQQSRLSFFWEQVRRVVAGIF